jgi:hypothetical protein
MVLPPDLKHLRDLLGLKALEVLNDTDADRPLLVRRGFAEIWQVSSAEIFLERFETRVQPGDESGGRRLGVQLWLQFLQLALCEGWQRPSFDSRTLTYGSKVGN